MTEISCLSGHPDQISAASEFLLLPEDYYDKLERMARE